MLILYSNFLSQQIIYLSIPGTNLVEMGVITKFELVKSLTFPKTHPSVCFTLFCRFII